MPTGFVLHPQLAKDCAVIGDFPLSRLLRMNDQNYPWLVLVPRHATASELIDLSGAEQSQLLHEIAALSQVMRRTLTPDKLNVAALGNVVPQLHVHVIARYRRDAAWPRPIWGVVPMQPFPAETMAAEIETWRKSLAPSGLLSSAIV